MLIPNCLKKCDLFSTSQFLRYQKQPEYKTATGGCCSIFVVIFFIILFKDMALQTINKQIIKWNATTKTSFIPSSVSIDTQSNKFMFAVTLVGINLNDPHQRFFDIQIRERHFQGGSQLQKNKIKMVQCTQQHFNINPQIAKTYKQLSADRSLCPPLGYKFTLQGKYTTESFKTVQVHLAKCKNQTDSSRPCVSDATLNQYMAKTGQFQFSFVYVNPIINPGSQNYLEYFLDDRNYLRFTTKLGARSTGYVQDYSIETDDSLLPHQEKVEDKGIIIPDLFQNIAYQVTGNNYASFFIMKSSSNVIYQRSFNKIDSFFSFVGGLIGIIIGFMVIVKTYTEMSYELDLSQKIFKYKKDDTSNSYCFNMLTYCLFLVYSLLNFFGLGKQWQLMIKYNECKKEMVNQLDIQMFFKRIIFLQRAIETLLEEKQIIKLHSQQLDSLDKIKERVDKEEIQHKDLVLQSQDIGQNLHQNTEKNQPQKETSSNNATIEIKIIPYQQKVPKNVGYSSNKKQKTSKKRESSDRKSKNNQNYQKIEETINQYQQKDNNKNIREFDQNIY